MLIALIGLVLVKVPGIGVRVNGAERWIVAGPITMQPSEFAKLAVVVFCRRGAAARKRPPRTVKELANPIGVLALVVCALVALEPDLGTTIAIAITVTGMLIVAGTPFRLLVGTSAIVLGTGAAFVISQNAYMHARLLAFMHPWHDAGGSGYQNVQALIALGSGGIWGKGLGQGTVRRSSTCPESPRDMIAAVIGEELGLIGILVTALAFAGFAVLGFRIAMRARDPFGEVPRRRHDLPRHRPGGREPRARCWASCPLTGVPLPLISSGGSSLVVFMTLLRHAPQRRPGRTPPRPRDRFHLGCHQRTPPAIPTGERRC